MKRLFKKIFTLLVRIKNKIVNSYDNIAYVNGTETLPPPLSTAEELEALGCAKVAVNDLARCDMAEAVEDAFRYGKIVLATTTYNGDIFPFTKEFIHHLTDRNYQNRTVAFIENGSWAPCAGRVMKGMLETMKEIEIVEPMVTIRSAMKQGDIPALEALADAMLA